MAPDGQGRTIRAERQGAAAARSPSFKYDLLTALGSHACGGDKHLQRLALRLMTLVCARYDWRHDSLTTGQREIAALWSVDERTVKREMATLRAMGWLVLKRPAARGRVACHGLGIECILAATRPSWERVGPDFTARMAGPDPVSAGGNVVPFAAPGGSPGGETGEEAGGWGAVCRSFHATDPAAAAAWIGALRLEAVQDGRLVLRAPSAFHADYVRTHLAAKLVALARPVLGEVTAVEFV